MSCGNLPGRQQAAHQQGLQHGYLSQWKHLNSHWQWYQNFTVSLTSPCCYGSTLSPGLPTLLVRKMESWWASWLDACCLLLHEYISISSSHKAHSNTRLSIVFGERLRWRGWGSPRHMGGGEKTEWTRERKARGEEEEGRIEQREREAILQTCDTLIINKLGLNA